MAELMQIFTADQIKLHGVPLSSGIGFALDKLQHDLLQVFDKEIMITTAEEADIVVLSHSQLKDYPGLAEKVQADALLDETGSVIWESYLMTLLDGKIYIIGGDKRGTIFGVYDLTRRIGVSPWYFFGDVPVKQKDSFALPADFRVVDWPSVKYRGIFINDEEELNHWAKKHTEDGTIGPETYYHVFELLLRLKANYIWPAMHVNYFNENPENGALADNMGVIVGTSHCDMLLRSNQNEWHPWLESKGYEDKGIKYDYSIEGWNREKLQEYWRESVEMNQAYDVSYTVGMRGIHDTGFVTEAIDNDRSLSDSEKHQKKKALLEQVIADQRYLLATTIKKDAKDIFQTFVPYKEVLKYYDDGLQIPEDVTIIWANDNYGYMRRYPSVEEQKRPGGHGLYYHSSYWSSNNMHYLFISSTPLARMKNELQKAWDNGIQKLWVLNVGAIKAIEQDLEFYTRFAWEIGKESTTKDVDQFLADWIDTEFSGNLGAEVGPLLNRFSQVTNVRKIEMMAENVFAQNTFGDEAASRLNELHEMFTTINQLAAKLPVAEKEAFFQLVQMKFHAAYFKNGEFYFADRSAQAYQDGKMPAADLYRERSEEFTQYLRWMVYYFNKVMSDGKWDEILTPEVAPPPNMQMYPTTKPALKITEGKLGYKLWQGAKVTTELNLSPEGQSTKWVELFNTGSGVIEATVSAPAWLTLSQTEVSLTTEARILTTVNWEKVGNDTTGELTVTTAKGEQLVIPVVLSPAVSGQAQGVVEADGYLEIVTANFESKTDQGQNAWTTIPYLGRYQGDALEAHSPKMTALATDNAAELPQVSYSFYLKTTGSHLAEFYRLPSLNSVGQIRFGVAIDDLPMQIVETQGVDEHLGNWAEGVKNEVDKLYLQLPYLAEGQHTLRLFMIDTYVCLSKAVIYTEGFGKTSLGMPTEQSATAQTLPVFADVEKALCEATYQSDLSVVTPPDLIFADAEFYAQDFINATIVKAPQSQMGQKTYQAREDGQKDVVTDYLAGTKIKAQGTQIAFEAELALADNQTAYRTAAFPGEIAGTWEHVGTPTDDGTGLGMGIISQPNTLWEDTHNAPAMHFNLEAAEAGNYKVWLLLKYDGREGAEMTVGANGQLVAPEDREIPKGLFHFLTTSLWHWNHFADVELSEGQNEFSIHGISGNIKIDRVFLTKTDQLPPVAEKWHNTYA